MTGTDIRAGSCGYLLNQQTLYKNKICAKMPKQAWNNMSKNDEMHKNI